MRLRESFKKRNPRCNSTNQFSFSIKKKQYLLKVEVTSDFRGHLYFDTCFFCLFLTENESQNQYFHLIIDFVESRILIKVISISHQQYLTNNISPTNSKGAQKSTLVTHGTQILYKYHSLEQQQVNVPLLIEAQKFGITWTLMLEKTQTFAASKRLWKANC